MRILVMMMILSLHAQADDSLTSPLTNSETVSQDQALDQVRDELTNMERRWYGLMRIRWHDTLRYSAGAGAMLVKQPHNIDCATGCAIRGWNFEVEAGLYGMQGGIGWGRLVGETGRTRRLMHTVHWGWNVRGVIMRTWGDSTLYPQSQTLAGIEASVSIIRMNISAGILKSLYSGPGEEFGEDWIITTGFGWGF